MKVSVTQNQSYNNIHFGALARIVGFNQKTLPKSVTSCPLPEFYKKILYCNDTYWFRGDLRKKVDDIVDMYKNVNHVNTYSYGCSNGSEPCSIRMYLVSKYGEEIASKFGIIKAKDIDPYAIKTAKSGEVPIASVELGNILKYTGGNINKFFYGEEAGINDGIVSINEIPEKFLEPFLRCTFISPHHKIFGSPLKQKPELTQNIEYSVADITEDWKNIEPENSVVFAQSFWPYLTRTQITELLSNLGQHLHKGSSLIFSYFDLISDSFAGRDFGDFMVNELKLNGFSQYKSESQYIFVKE